MTTPQPAWWQEAPLVAVHLVVVLGFSRVYDDGSFLVPLAFVVLAAHGLAIATRRHGTPRPLVALAGIGGGLLVVTWALLPATTTWGLPTLATWTEATGALAEAREQFAVVIAPAAVLVGFQLAAAAALWAGVWFADATAWRLGGPVEALGPAAALFGFCAVLGDGSHGIALAGAFAAACLAHLGATRVATAAAPVAGRDRATRRALGRSVAAVGALAVLGGMAIGPHLPGTDADAAVGWRAGRGGGTRVTVSPLVEINGRLVEQSDLQVFEVRSPVRAYWRLTSLERFDGDIWSSSGEYREADGVLDGEPTVGRGEVFTQQIQIDALSTIWVPAAFEAVAVRAPDDDLRWDPTSSTLIVEAAQTTSDGLTYEVDSRAAELSPAVLGQATGDDPRELEATYEELPDDFPAAARAAARQVTAGATSRYEQARALQDWFRSEFTYSLDVAAGHGEQAVLDFLEAREGYCEQFAGTYAAMARSLGMPARVAVGFTPGDVDDEDPQRYAVRGRNAHAWPEVWFPTVGWVPFEPTPGRGIPGAERYTGVAEQQAGDGPQGAPATTALTTAVPATTAPEGETSAPTTATPTDGVEATATPSGGGDGEDDGGLGWWPALVAVALAAIAAVVWRRRRRGAHEPDRPPADERWTAVVAHLRSVTGVDPRPADTAVEHAARVAPALAEHDPERAEALRRLAALVSADRWSPEGLGPDELAQVDALARQLLTARRPEPAGAR